MSVGILVREHGRFREPLRLNSFMRLVERVRRNCIVKSAAQFSGRGACSPRGCRCGTGFRRGTPLLSDMASILLSSAVCVVSVEERCGCWSRDEVDESVPARELRLAADQHSPRTAFFPQRRCRFTVASESQVREYIDGRSGAAAAMGLEILLSRRRDCVRVKAS